MITAETNRPATIRAYTLTAADARLANALRKLGTGTLSAQLGPRGLRLMAADYVAYFKAETGLTYAAAGVIYDTLKGGDSLSVADGGRLCLARSGVANGLQPGHLADDWLEFVESEAVPTGVQVASTTLAQLAKSSTDRSYHYGASVCVDVLGGVWATDGARLATYGCQHLADGAEPQTCQLDSVLVTAMAAYRTGWALNRLLLGWMLASDNVLVSLPGAKDGTPRVGRIMAADYEPTTLAWELSPAEAMQIAKAIRSAIRGFMGKKADLRADVHLGGVELWDSSSRHQLVAQIDAYVARASALRIDPAYLADLLETMAARENVTAIVLCQGGEGRAIEARAPGADAAYYLMPLRNDR